MGPWGRKTQEGHLIASLSAGQGGEGSKLTQSLLDDKCNGGWGRFIFRAGDLMVINKVAFNDGIYRQMLFQKDVNRSHDRKFIQNKVDSQVNECYNLISQTGTLIELHYISRKQTKPRDQEKPFFGFCLPQTDIF